MGGGEMLVSDILRERIRRPGAKNLTTPIHESCLRSLTLLVLHAKHFVRTTVVALVRSLYGILEGTAAIFVCCLTTLRVVRTVWHLKPYCYNCCDI
jgi:hypothetical protein